MADKKNNTGVDNSGYWNSGNGNSGNGNSGNWNSGDWNSGDRNSGYRNSGNWNSGNGNSGYGNSGYWNSGNLNSGYGNSGDRNSGNWNSGNLNSGIFNTNEPKMRAFNKESDMTYTEFRAKYDYKDIDFPLNVWRDKSDMTDEEKKSVSGWETMGGYLKTLGYKEAWAAGWAKATDKQKEWYKSLPNFDAKIFEEITGIKIGGENDLKGKLVEVKIDGKEYKAVIQ
jgi:hypothetical protein